MPSLADIRSYLTFGQIVAYALLLSKLFKTHLFEKYRGFSFLLGFELLRLLFMSSLPARTNLYAYVYFATSPIVWVLFVLVVLEIFQLVLKNHVGIATMGRKAVSAALCISAAVSAGTLFLDLQRTSNTEAALLFNFMLLERMVMTSLLVLLLCLIGFVSHFPVPLSRNVRVHACIFAGYFAMRTALLFTRVWFGIDIAPVVNVMFACLALACLGAWVMLLTPRGEALHARRVNTASDERLLKQLEAINQSLLRSARK